MDYKIHGLEDLHANLNLGYDVAKTTGRNFVNSNSVQSSLDKTFTGLGQGNTWNNLRRNHLLDFYMNYAKNIESIKSNFDIMAGYSWQHFYYANHDIPMTKTNGITSVMTTVAFRMKTILFHSSGV